MADDPKEAAGGLSKIVDVATDLVTGATIPTPLRKNAFKAFGQLCSAAIEIPVAHLEGIAAEKRAETAARVRLIAEGADQIAAQMKLDPKYAARAAHKAGERIVKEQVNLDQISASAAQQLNADPSEARDQLREAEPEPISDDWLNAFEKEASQKSTQEMQQLFARILAGEIRRPTSFSIRTVRLLGQIDAHAAARFRRLCSLSISMRTPDGILDARVPSLRGSAADNSLQSFGLSFAVLNTLHEYGLIIPDYNSYIDVGASILRGTSIGIPFTYQNNTWGLAPVHEPSNANSLRVHGVQLSHSGRELLPIVDVENDATYTTALQDFFLRSGFTMKQVNVEWPT